MLDKQGYMHARACTRSGTRTQICKIYGLVTATMVRQSPSVLRYTYMVCLVYNTSNDFVSLKIFCIWIFVGSWVYKGVFRYCLKLQVHWSVFLCLFCCVLFAQRINVLVWFKCSAEWYTLICNFIRSYSDFGHFVLFWQLFSFRRVLFFDFDYKRYSLGCLFKMSYSFDRCRG